MIENSDHNNIMGVQLMIYLDFLSKFIGIFGYANNALTIGNW